MVLYDVTTLYFEAEDEDDLRKVGMSKERRDHHLDSRAGLFPGPARCQRHRRGRGRGDAHGGESDRAGGRRIFLHCRVTDQQGPVRFGRVLHLRGRTRRR